MLDNLYKIPVACKLRTHSSQKLTHSKTDLEVKVKSKNFVRKVTATLKTLQKYYEPPEFTTSVSTKVCPRKFSNIEEEKVLELKRILNKRSSILARCPAQSREKEERDFRDGIDFANDLEKEVSGKDSLVRISRNVRSRRGLPCDTNPMTGNEEDVRDGLAIIGIPSIDICVKQEGVCMNRGTVDTTTNTINMCHFCRYFVHLPTG